MKKVIGAKNCTLQLNKQALVYPPLEGGSKSLISGWGNNCHKNLTIFFAMTCSCDAKSLRGATVWIGDEAIHKNKTNNGENDEHIFINTIFNIHATYSITICDIAFVYKK